MKRVTTLLAFSLMTLLIGCSFSKDSNSKENTNPEMPIKKSDIIEFGKVTDIESAIRYLPAENIKIYFKEIPTTKLNTPFANGKTAIEVAIERGNGKILKDLLDLGASPFIRNTMTKKSGFELGRSQSYYTQRKENLNSLQLDATIWSSLLTYRQKIKILLGKKMYTEFLMETEEKNIPCDEVLQVIVTLNKSKNFTIPADVLTRFLGSSACKEDFTQMKPLKLFSGEFDNQLKRNFANISILEFLSKKFPSQIFYKDLSTDKNRSIVISHAALLLWGLQGKVIPETASVLQHLHKLSNFPGEAALIISKSKQEPAATDSFMTLNEVLGTQDTEILEDLKDSFRFYDGLLDDLIETGVLK